jgi:hypothetical protein
VTRALSDEQKTIIAWDGEGYTDDNLDHHYMLFQNSLGGRIYSPHLTTSECLKFLIETAGDNPHAIHIIYGGGYDAAMMLADIPYSIRKDIKDDNPVAWLDESDPDNYTIYNINYLAHKWLQVKAWSYKHNKFVIARIYDLMTFFQSSFISALLSRQMDVPEEIKSGKAARSDFTYDDLEEISTYCGMEVSLLVSLFKRLRSEGREAGLEIQSWHGPAAFAKKAFQKFNVLEHTAEFPDDFRRATQYAYHAGHIQVAQVGHYVGDVHVADIRSAYPFALTQLPSFKGARITRTKEYVPGAVALYRISVDYGYRKSGLYPTPWRGSNGAIGYPRNVDTWIWWPEYQPEMQVIDGYIIEPASQTKPFEYIREMYEIRRQWKAEGRGGEKVLKLCMNSSYGALAQRIGARDGTPPKFHNLAWAGMITSITRAKLWDAISQAPESVIAVETDSITTTVPLNLTFGDALGEWDSESHSSITYLQSGIYFSDGQTPNAKVRTRGLSVKDISESMVLEWLASDRTEPMLVADSKFFGLGSPRTAFYARWTDTVKEVGLPAGKNMHIPAFCDACQRGESLAATLHRLTPNPLYGGPSAPHTLPWVDESATPDGLAYIGDAIYEYERRH